MNVNLSNAVRMFYGKSSYEMVYMEAIANSLDAKATEINIDISVKSKKIADTLQVIISDNGIGFTDSRFKKFSNLFDTEDTAHKGLGRLAYRFYFNDVQVESWYDNNKHRKFSFSDDFDGKSNVDTVNEDDWHSGTKLYLSDYIKKRLYNNNMIDVKSLKTKILSHFYLRLFLLKKQNANIVINLTSNIDGNEKNAVISTDDIPDFKTIPIDAEDIGVMFTDMTLYYYVEKTDDKKPSNVVTAINVDGRTYAQHFITTDISLES